jgi:hypothetical protein
LKHEKSRAVIKSHKDLTVNMDSELWKILEESPWVTRVWKE